ncbi:complex I NDUFA9 subunit family protein [Halocynthiibacter styelae]|uniref:Complex I NDUFA9 subunit family protein n=1 Tax=Halocynthiibacter styelae TaxID=2761955 RepID=A0A8J7ISK6_9RHOB|nr:complex I NDUFA9 subunit family protein [Paenihalocynthiibacter styelae]MBI1494796.1 complex I NDUFA9 subunit family protein [Paenihalocynthiibacter styelae]
MSGLVTIFGGAGFVGRYIARRMAKEGWRVRVAGRRPNESLHVKPYGTPGQVEPVFCNIRDDASVRAVMQGADAVVNCVGILDESGRQSFDAVQSEGAGRIARIAAEEGIARLVHLSAIGASAESTSKYQQSKAAGEANVLAHFHDAVILRPSVIFGPEDGFFNKIAGLSRFTPVMPVFAGSTKFQPVYVDDVAKAAVAGATSAAAPGVYELGGAEVITFREAMEKALEVSYRKRILIGLPMFIAHIKAGALSLIEMLSLGAIPNFLMTRDQLRSLADDNVVSEGAKTLADLGIDPVRMDSVLSEYLWRYRPSGQYDDIRDSAANLRD